MRRPLALAAATLALTGCNRMVIPGLMDTPIVPGGQAELDAGNVVDLTGWCVGYNGIHIGGHYSSHGSVFASLPDNLREGDQVTLAIDGASTTYTVVSQEQIPNCSGMWGDAVIQTSAGPGMMVWHLSLTEVRPSAATVDTQASRLP